MFSKRTLAMMIGFFATGVAGITLTQQLTESTFWGTVGGVATLGACFLITKIISKKFS